MHQEIALSTAPAKPERWIMQAPVISTRHLKQATLEALQANSPQHANEFGFYTMPTDCGAMVYCSDAGELEGDPEVPEDLRACLAWNLEQGYEWLRFDESGDVIAELPQYDWEKSGGAE